MLGGGLSKVPELPSSPPHTHSNACLPAHCASTSPLLAFLFFHCLQILLRHLLDLISACSLASRSFPSWLSSSLPFNCSHLVFSDKVFLSPYAEIQFVCPVQYRVLQQIIVLIQFRSCQMKITRMGRSRAQSRYQSAVKQTWMTCG